jgi:hypothetical protein
MRPRRRPSGSLRPDAAVAGRTREPVGDAVVDPLGAALGIAPASSVLWPDLPGKQTDSHKEADRFSSGTV